MFSARGGFEYTSVGTAELSFIASFNAGATPAIALANSNGSNVYLIGTTNTDGNDLSLIKLDGNGNVQWQKKIAGTTGSTQIARDAVLDSSENIYVCGQDSVATANYQGYLCKVDTTGVIQWQRTFGSTYTQDNEPGVALEPGGANVFITLSGNATAYVGMYSNAGGLQYSRQVDTSSDTAIDVCSSAGNVYGISQGGNYGYISKIDTSGTAQGAVSIRQTGQTIVPIASTVDSTGNVFVLSVRSGGNIVVSKHYSNAAIISSISYANANSTSGGIAVDSSDNIYVASASTNNLAWYAKLYNGNLESQWQRSFTTGNATLFKNISCAGNYVYIAGSGTNVAGTSFIAKLPNDGSGQGTHGIYTIANVAYSTSLGSFTTSTANAAVSRTQANGLPTLTISNSALTQTLTTF